MCSRFDLDIDIRAFQVQLGLEVENITHMRRPGDTQEEGGKIIEDKAFPSMGRSAML